MVVKGGRWCGGPWWAGGERWFLECSHGGCILAMWTCWWLTRWLCDGGEVSLGFGGKRRWWWWFWHCRCGGAVFFLAGAEFAAVRKRRLSGVFCVVVVSSDLDLCGGGVGGVRWWCRPCFLWCEEVPMGP